MRNKLIEDLKGFRTPICDGLYAKLPNVESLADYLISHGVIKELTEENEAWQKQLIATEEKSGKAYYEIACEVENLRKENENLHASCTELTQKCASLTEENERLSQSLANTKSILANSKADTVRKMQEIITANYAVSKVHYAKDEAPTITYQLTNWQLDQIAKEMLEGSKC